MRIDFEYREGVCIVRPLGRFRIGSNAALARTLEELRCASARRVTVDFSEVPYLDTTGIAFLLGIHNSLCAAGGTLAVCGLTPRAAETLRLTHLDRALVVYPGIRQAVESMAAIAA